MKRLIFTLIALLTVSFANAQTLTEYKMVVNENGLLFRAGEVTSVSVDTIVNGHFDYYADTVENIDYTDYEFTHRFAPGTVTIYDIYGNIVSRFNAFIDDSEAFISELGTGAYIIALYGYRPFVVVNGHYSVNKSGKFTPIK